MRHPPWECANHLAAETIGDGVALSAGAGATYWVRTSGCGCLSSSIKHTSLLQTDEQQLKLTLPAGCGQQQKRELS